MSVVGTSSIARIASTKARSWTFSRFRLNRGAGTIVRRLSAAAEAPARARRLASQRPNSLAACTRRARASAP
ncbi:MAG TPA: hypothetical protein VF010_09960, partial [Methylomirabilota bacterium]|nr:hypothetical protein [Methylomirabilota bacterium]